jgi:hypothetical protein
MINIHGQLEIPLYHGTSSFFIDSIKEHGLGGHRDQGLFDLSILALLVDCLSKPENKTEWWEDNSYIVGKMGRQAITAGNFNFRHGGTYLTPSKFTAANYASNKMGSELLTTLYDGFVALESINSKVAEGIIPNGHKLREVFRHNHRSCLITATGVDAKSLKTEQGEDIYDQLKAMEDLKNKLSDVPSEQLWQQYNFEICDTLDSQSINFAEFPKL